RAFAGKGVAGEEREDRTLPFEEALLGLDDPLVGAPGAERGEPEVPLEARLIRRVDAWRGLWILRLVTGRVGLPSDAVARALELDFVTRLRHHGEETVAVGDARVADEDRWPREEEHVGRHEERGDRGVEDPREGDGGAPRSPAPRKGASDVPFGKR